MPTENRFAEQTAPNNPNPVASSIGGAPEVKKEGMLTSATVTTDVLTNRIVRERPSIKLGYPYELRELKTIVEREHLVGSFAFSIANVRGQKMYALALPGVFYGYPNIMSKLTNLAFYRAGATVRFKVIGNITVAGKLRVGYLKNCSYADINADVSYDDLAWMDPHIIDLQSSNDVVIKIPWMSNVLAHPLPFESNTVCDIAYLVVFCEHTLQSSLDDTQPPITIQVYAKLEDMEFYGDVADHSISATVHANALKRSDKEALVKKLLSDLEADKQSAIVSDALGKIVDMAASPGDAPPKDNHTVGSIISSSLPNLMEALSLCKPLTPQVPSVVTMVRNFDAHTASGVANLPSMGFHTRVQKEVPTELMFQDARPIEKINDLATMPAPIAYCSLDSTSQPGSLLMRIPISPAYTTFTDGTDFGAHTPSPCVHTAMQFQHWRGSMKYSMIVSGPQVSSGKVGVNYYPVTAALPTNNAERLAAHGEILGMIVDLHGSSMKDFVVPYLNNFGAIQILPASQCQLADVSNAGYLEFFVIQAPAAPGGAGTYQITLEAAAGEDSRWFNASPTYGKYGNTDALVTPIDPDVTWTYQQSLLDHFSKPFPMFDKADSVNGGAIFSADEVVTIKELACLPTLFAGSYTSNSGIITAPGQPSSGTSTGEQTFTKEYWTCFRGWRGSRYVWFDSSSGVSGNATFVAIMTDVSQPGFAYWQRLDRHPIEAYLGMGPPRTRATDRGFCIPWVCPRGLYAQNYWCRYPHIISEGPYLSTYVSGSGNFYIAFGDDYKVGGLCPPRAWIFPPVPPGLKNALALKRKEPRLTRKQSWARTAKKKNSETVQPAKISGGESILNSLVGNN